MLIWSNYIEMENDQDQICSQLVFHPTHVPYKKDKCAQKYMEKETQMNFLQESCSRIFFIISTKSRQVPRCFGINRMGIV